MRWWVLARRPSLIHHHHHRADKLTPFIRMIHSQAGAQNKLGVPASTPTLTLNDTMIDPGSETAHALRLPPEQEALFVQETTAKRKFEDADLEGERIKRD